MSDLEMSMEQERDVSDRFRRILRALKHAPVGADIKFTAGMLREGDSPDAVRAVGVHIQDQVAAFTIPECRALVRAIHDNKDDFLEIHESMNMDEFAEALSSSADDAETMDQTRH